MNTRVLPWVSFALILALAWSFGNFGWALGSLYMQGQFLLFGLTVLAGVGVVVLSSVRKRVSVPIVLGGLVLANIGLLEVLAMAAIWKFGSGFAP